MKLDTLVNPLASQVLSHFKNNNNSHNNNSHNNNSHNNNSHMVFITILLIIIFQMLPIMLIAVNCNPNNPIMYGIIAFLIPNIYLFQHSFRKYLMREKGYCNNK